MLVLKEDLENIEIREELAFKVRNKGVLPRLLKLFPKFGESVEVTDTRGKIRYEAYL